jgi:hypothetical protein
VEKQPWVYDEAMKRQCRNEVSRDQRRVREDYFPVAPTNNSMLARYACVPRLWQKTILRGPQTSPLLLGFSTFVFVVLQAAIRYHEIRTKFPSSARRLRLRLAGMERSFGTISNLRGL